MSGVAEPYARRRAPAQFDPGWFDFEHQNIQRALAGAEGDTGWFNPRAYPGDAASQLRAGAADALAKGGNLVIPPGAWNLASQVTISVPMFRNFAIWAYDATIATTGAISGLRITGGAYGGTTVFGLRVDHRDNTAATYGFEVAGAWACRLFDCYVEAQNNGVNYGAAIVRNLTPSDPNTGSFYTHFDNFQCRIRGGALIPNGIILQGAANGASITGGVLNDVTTGVLIRTEAGQSYIANAVTIDRLGFEDFGTGISAISPAGECILGLKVENCRAELGTTFASFTGTALQSKTPPKFSNNFLVSNVTNYISNPNGIYIQSSDYDESGSTAFAAATTATVTFARSQPDTNYRIQLAPNANKAFWWTSKTTAGFTLNASAASSDTVDWSVTR